MFLESQGGSNEKNEVTIRSSAVEYLTYIAANGEQGIEIRYEDENVRLTQKMMVNLYGVELPTINEHIKTIFKNNEFNN